MVIKNNKPTNKAIYLYISYYINKQTKEDKARCTEQTHVQTIHTIIQMHIQTQWNIYIQWKRENTQTHTATHTYINQ